VNPPERHLSALDLDVLRLAGDTGAAEAPARAHLAGCLLCQRRQADRRQQATAFERHRLPALLARPPGRSRRSAIWLLGLGLPAAAGLALRAWTRTGEPQLGIKGPPAALRLVVRRGADVFEVQDGDQLAPGDALRFVVAEPPHPHLLVASVDGAGQVSVYFPFGGDGSAPIDTRTAVEVPAGSIVLDRTPGPERVFALFSPAPLAAAPVRQLLEALGRQGAEAIRRQTQLPLPDTLQITIHFEKSPPHLQPPEKAR
jgi:hypothetical protein